MELRRLLTSLKNSKFLKTFSKSKTKTIETQIPNQDQISSFSIRKWWVPIGLTTTALFGFAYNYNSRYNSYNINARASDKEIIVLLNEDDGQKREKKPIRIHIYRLLPWRTLSRTSGWLFNLNLPHWTNQRLLSWYVKRFNVNLSEARLEDLRQYKNLAELFTRQLKDEVRPVHASSELVSPCDGNIVQFTKIQDDTATGLKDFAIIPPVKGIIYSIQTFLGLSPGLSNQLTDIKLTKLRDQLYASLPPSSMSLPTSLYCCIIYLAPGDYHRFHSPANWQIKFRRHCPGELLSVKPSLTKWIPEIFTLNERVIYIGNWHHGLFSMSAVGATNVGSITIYDDKELITNTRMMRRRIQDKWFGDNNEKPVKYKKGEPFGQFNLGSTLVLIFQAPSYLEKKFLKKVGKSIKYGESLM